jgi:hypothetical protein
VNGFAVRRYKGPKKADPEFDCCLPCMNDLRRAGLRGVKEVYVDQPTWADVPVNIRLAINRYVRAKSRGRVVARPRSFGRSRRRCRPANRRWPP